jgi:hypothetical protein
MADVLRPEFFLAFDNGTSANGVALLGTSLVEYVPLPIRYELSYTKEEHHITRLDAPKMEQQILKWNLDPTKTLVLMERPMINPTRFRASISAVRCLEAELIVIEKFGLNVEYVDSKQWQRILLPNIEGSSELKKASLELGKKLFPNLKLKKDADSLLIAYWAKNRSTLETVKPPKPKKTL